MQSQAKADRLLVLSAGAGTMDSETQARLRSEFSDHLIVEFDPDADLRSLVAPQGEVVVAGGDGTVEAVLRTFADSDNPVGILPLGTFNNLATSLGLPSELSGAIATVRTGRARPITAGKVNGHVFFEACAIGLFGDAIVLGDAAKDLEFGAVLERLKDFIEAEAFQYDVSGDLRGSGSAMSLVFSNTSSIGTRLVVGDATPVDPYLEFSADAGRSRLEIVAQVLGAVVAPGLADNEIGRGFRFRQLSVTTRPRARLYADNRLVGETPAAIAAEAGAVKVILPEAVARR